MMRACVAVGGAGLAGLTFQDRPVPEPGPGEALVRIHAATLNFRDLIILKGLLAGLARQPDYVPLSCAAGQVVAVGDGVTRVKVGDRVSPLMVQGWIGDIRPPPGQMLGGSLDGVARPFATFNAESLVHLPDTLDDMEAATLPCAGLTAYNALFGVCNLQRGQWVLVQGTGGVSVAALQWAKAIGAHVAVTSSSDEKLAHAASLGADLTVNYRTVPDWGGAVRNLLGHGVDIVVDVVGANGLDASARVLRDGGTIAAIGMLDGPFNWSKPDHAGHPIRPVTVGNRARHEAALAFAARHKVHPIVEAVYPLERLAEALTHLESGRFFGKIGIEFTA